jgi:hypothetical protein
VDRSQYREGVLCVYCFVLPGTDFMITLSFDSGGGVTGYAQSGLSAASTAPEYTNIKAKIRFFIVALFAVDSPGIPQMTPEQA